MQTDASTLKLRPLALVLLGILGLGGLFVGALLHRPPLPDEGLLPVFHCPRDSSREDDLALTYAGIATLKISDGQTTLATDGFFTRTVSARDALFNHPIAPDSDAVDRAITSFGLEGLAALMVGHSHYDHALDAGLVALRTGADLIGSASTLNIGRGAGLDEAVLINADDHGEHPRCYGDFCIRFIRSRHLDYPFGLSHNPGTIDAPLVPPAPLQAYKAGTTYMILIDHRRHGRLLIVNSANTEPGALAGVRAEILLLGIGGLGHKSRNFYVEPFFTAVLATRPRAIIVIHFEDLFSDPARPSRMSVIADNLPRTLRMLRRMTDRPVGRLRVGEPAAVLRRGRLACAEPLG